MTANATDTGTENVPLVNIAVGTLIRLCGETAPKDVQLAAANALLAFIDRVTPPAPKRKR